jgi:hypothetical protein
MQPMIFYLGTDDAYWLWDNTPPHPLFISRRRLERYKNLKPSNTRWALDSGGFTELNMYGEWRTSPHKYVALVQRYANEIGNLDWAAPQDWMCEPSVLAKTGKTVTEHQQLTVNNYLTLKTLSPTLPIIPALQGWQPDDYLRHIEMYDKAGIDLTKAPTVGMGTFCRRANLKPVHNLVYRLWENGLKMHGFGVKQDGLPIMGNYLQSADSLAWSLTARLAPGPLCGTQHRAKKCSHCRTWATQWANNINNNIGTAGIQPELF